MSLLDKAKKFLDKSNKKKHSNHEVLDLEVDWIEFRENLDQKTINFLDKHAIALSKLNLKECDIYAMLKKFEFMENVVDC